MATKLEKYGIMVGLVTPFTADGQFDEKAFMVNIERCIEAGANTIYTTGGAAEFFSIEMDDFKALVKAYARAASRWSGNKQIGCSWINTEGTVDRIKFCLDNGIDSVQVTAPFWLHLCLDEMIAFFAQLARECPRAKVLHYNAAQSKNVLTGKDYARIAQEAPNLVGTKITTTSFMEWLEIVTMSPMLDHCCCEPSLVPFAMTGAAGVATSWFSCNPVWFKSLYDDCVAGCWAEAMQKQIRMHEAYQKLVFPYYYANNLSDAAIDKALAYAGGFMAGGVHTRSPLGAISEEVLEKFVAEMRSEFPDLMYKP